MVHQTITSPSEWSSIVFLLRPVKEEYLVLDVMLDSFYNQFSTLVVSKGYYRRYADVALVLVWRTGHVLVDLDRSKRDSDVLSSILHEKMMEIGVLPRLSGEVWWQTPLTHNTEALASTFTHIGSISVHI